MQYEPDIEKLANYDEKELQKLIKALSPIIIDHINKHFSLNKSIAEDIWQETLIKMIKNISNIKDSKHFLNWIFIVARNLARDTQRRSVQEENYLRELNEKELESIKSAIRNPGENCESGDEESKQVHVIKSAIDKLPDEKKELLKKRYYFKLTEKEIAIELKKPEGTVKAHLSRLRNQLKDEIEPYINLKKSQGGN